MCWSASVACRKLRRRDPHREGSQPGHSQGRISLLGPSGSGKTTSLMMLAGFETPTAGEILLAGRSINNVPPHKRDIGMVFQNYALFPHDRGREPGLSLTCDEQDRRRKGSSARFGPAQTPRRALSGFERNGATAGALDSRNGMAGSIWACNFASTCSGNQPSAPAASVSPWRSPNQGEAMTMSDRLPPQALHPGQLR